MRLSELKRERPDTFTGRTPPDWDLKRDDGTPYYLRLEVKRAKCDEWQDYRSARNAWMLEAGTKSVISDVTGKPASTKALERKLMKKLEGGQAARRQKFADEIKAVRKILLVNIEAVLTEETPDEGFFAHHEMLIEAQKLKDNSPDDEDLAREYESLLKKHQDMYSDDVWLADKSSDSPGEEVTDEELGIYFHGALQDDAVTYEVPNNWSFCLADKPLTLCQALLRVIYALSELADKDIESRSRDEVEDLKGTASGGQNDEPANQKPPQPLRAAS